MAIGIEISVTAPKEIFNSQVAIERIAAAQRLKTAPKLKALFKETTEGWEHKPDWSERQSIGRDYISMTVFVSGEHAEQYRIVNNGAPAHIITPRSARMLRFRTGYVAGTRPRSLTSRAKQRFGNYISTRSVNHPGLEARQFDEVVAETHEPEFRQDMQDAFRKP